jgi:BTB/POZ domain-containing protein 3/6
VQIEPDHFYTALAVLDGAELSYFGQEGMTEVTVGGITFQFQARVPTFPTILRIVVGGQSPEHFFRNKTLFRNF